MKELQSWANIVWHQNIEKYFIFHSKTKLQVGEGKEKKMENVESCQTGWQKVIRFVRLQTYAELAGGLYNKVAVLPSLSYTGYLYTCVYRKDQTFNRRKKKRVEWNMDFVNKSTGWPMNETFDGACANLESLEEL